MSHLIKGKGTFIPEQPIDELRWEYIELPLAQVERIDSLFLLFS